MSFTNKNEGKPCEVIQFSTLHQYVNRTEQIDRHLIKVKAQDYVTDNHKPEVLWCDLILRIACLLAGLMDSAL